MNPQKTQKQEDLSTLDPVQCVLESTEYVLQHAKHVKINSKRLSEMTQEIALQVWDKLSSNTNVESVLSNDGFLESLLITWDNEGVHFFDPEHPDVSAQYILVLSSLNFCFWPGAKKDGQHINIEYDFLAGSLRDVLKENLHAFDADRLMNMTTDTLKTWFKGVELPMAEERVRLIREVGTILHHFYEGKAANLISAAKQSAVRLVYLVASAFAGFRDHAIYNGKQVFLYKRAQIFAADVWGAFKGKGLGYFNDIHKLTMFADYRVPQILRHWKILEYSNELERTIDEMKEVLPGSPEEIEIRAATIQCVQMMRSELEKAHRIRAKSVEVDWYLWQKGEATKEEMKPHHRTLTIFY